MWPRRQDSEFTIAASCQLVRSCFRRGWRPIEIQLEHQAPRDASVLERIYGAPILFGQSGNRIVMSGIEYLLSKGAAVNVKNAAGESPLFFARKIHANKQIINADLVEPLVVEMLLKAGAKE